MFFCLFHIDEVRVQTSVQTFCALADNMAETANSGMDVSENNDAGEQQQVWRV